MKGILILWISVLFCLEGKSQTGDFRLPHSQQRSYKRIAANPSLAGNHIERFLIGKNYRQEWTDSIVVPVLDLKNDFGGLTPVKEGGGKQTHTLHMVDGSGEKWVLRSVEKFPGKVIAPELKGTIAETLIRDGISASYPYSVLSVGTLAKQADVSFLPNTLVYIPDDARLGEFRKKYKNTLAFLELRTVGNDPDQKMFDTQEIIPDLQESSGRSVDQNAALRARLLDNFLMDFDRYESQWIWVKRDSGGRKTYYPIPKDRDQVFFDPQGLLPRLVSGKPATGPLQGFRAKPKDIRTFNYSARNFDRLFLNGLDEADWASAIDRFLFSMKEDTIQEALRRQPKEILTYRAPQIAAVLERKKAFFKKDMLRYYRFLSHTVSVVGTNKADRFLITKQGDGTVKVVVSEKDDSTLFYERQFDPSVTKEIRLYGLEGDDRFLIDGDVRPITVRVVGGPGDDIISADSKQKKVLFYDVSFENNAIQGKGIKDRISSDPMNNEYRRLGTEYNSTSFGIFPEYSIEGHWFLGPSYTIKTMGFRKEPYAMRHFFYVTRSLGPSGWHLHYDGDFIGIAKNTDLLVRSNAQFPTIRTAFFGYGNESLFDKSKGAGYYRIKYTLAEGSMMIRHNLKPWVQLLYGPRVQYFNILPIKNLNYYLQKVYPSQFDRQVYDGRWYAGGEVKLAVNTRNSDLLPTRGVFSNLYTRQLFSIGEGGKEVNQTGGRFSFYTDALWKTHIVFANCFGADYNFGSFEIPQAQYLGYNQDLRGFRYQRFAGRARAYNNSELRINFGNANCYLFKGPVGILGFYDLGRVWAEGEESDIWHQDYGGGIWIAPFSKLVLTASIASSREEKAFPLVRFGFQF